jgi:hypothetical protein
VELSEPDTTVTITFTEPEARLLGAVVYFDTPQFPAPQEAVMRTLARKFAEAGEKKIAELTEFFGSVEAAEAWAAKWFAAHPEGDHPQQARA